MGQGVSSVLILSVEVERKSWYVRRLLILPLAIIVLLSFCVFWMDRSSLGDRVSVSFIGILTAVTFQLVMSEHLPEISYVTLTHVFLGWSFLVMCSTVVINLVVGELGILLLVIEQDVLFTVDFLADHKEFGRQSVPVG